MFIPRAQPHAQSLFLFPIVFGINLNHYFDEKKDGAAGSSIVLFRCFDPLSRIWQKQNEERELFRRAQRYWQRKVWTQRPSRGEKLWCKFLARKSAKLFANTIKGGTFWQGKVQNSSLLRWRHFRLSLSLCISLTERTERTIGSASALSTRPFAQLLPGLETGHPVTVGRSPSCSFSVSDGREVLFLSPFRAVLGAIHVQVTDRPSPDAPSLTQANNCANGLLESCLRVSGALPGQ